MSTQFRRTLAGAILSAFAGSALLFTGGSAETAPAATTAAATAVSTTVSATTTTSTSAERAEIGDTPPKGFKSRFEKVNGFRMHYLRGGEGTPVVLLHGFPQTWAEWRPQMKALSKDHDVIAVDLRGTGDSGVPKGGYDGVQMAKDVHKLLTQLGLNDGIQIVAHDIGMWAAYPYAAMWPSEVRRMAVMEAPIPDGSLFDFPALNPIEGQFSVWHFGLFQEELAEELIAGHEREFVEGFITPALAVEDAFGPAEFEFYAEYLREPGRMRAWLEMYRALYTDIAQNERLLARGQLPMPILAIGGEESLGAGVGAQWREYASNVKTRVVANSGHWITEEKPRKLTAMLRGFLQ